MADTGSLTLLTQVPPDPLILALPHAEPLATWSRVCSSGLVLVRVRGIWLEATTTQLGMVSRSQKIKKGFRPKALTESVIVDMDLIQGQTDNYISCRHATFMPQRLL